MRPSGGVQRGEAVDDPSEHPHAFQRIRDITPVNDRGF
jgi:hypothetical protein